VRTQIEKDINYEFIKKCEERGHWSWCGRGYGSLLFDNSDSTREGRKEEPDEG
jgi:hypothetical protein